MGGGQVFREYSGGVVATRGVELLGILCGKLVFEGGGGHIVGSVAEEGGGQVFSEGVLLGGG